MRASALTCGVVAAAAAGGLGDYPTESDLLVDTPGTTASAAGGFFNPAAWALQPNGGLFFAWDDAAASDSRAVAAALSLRHVGFGFRQWNEKSAPGGDFRVRDYVLGVGGGTRSSAWGLAYGWGGGDLDRQPRHERLVMGSVYRCRFASLGTATHFDLERRDYQEQLDLGIRPFGPWVTLFADAVYARKQSFSDIRSGYGLEARLRPGIAIAGKVRRGGEFAVRLSVALDPMSWLGVRSRYTDDLDHRRATTYAIDVGGPHASLGARLNPRRYPTLSLRGSLAYQRYRLFDSRPTFAGTLQSIDAMAADPYVGGVLVDLAGAQFSAAAAWELRAQLAGLRAHGKRVLVYCDRPGLTHLLLASVADEIWLHPSGLVDVSGLASGRTYMRRTLDKLGLGVDEWRFFTYKSAFEGWSRDSMSEPDRIQRQELIDDFYAEMAGSIGNARGIERARFDAIVDEQAVLRPDEAQAVGLVDSLGDFTAMERAASRARPRAPAARPEPAATLADLIVDPVWHTEGWGEPARIALLYAIGPCEMETGIRGRTLAKAIRDAARARNVQAIVLRVDSPGGDVLPSDLVARELRAAAARKPVIVSQGQVTASGGYWISADADTILATPLTLTGSIGVIGGWIWNQGLGDKLGFDYDGVQRGAHADLVRGIQLPLIGVTVPDRPMRSEERDRVEQLIRGTYDDFVQRVASARDLSTAEVDAVGQGRVWAGARARDHGLVDGIGGLWDALRMARTAAGVAPGRVVQIAPAPAPGLFDARVLRRQFLGWVRGESPAVVATSPAEVAAAATSPALAPWLDPANAPAGIDPMLVPAVERTFLETLLRHNGRPLVVVPPLAIEDGASGR